MKTVDKVTIIFALACFIVGIVITISKIRTTREDRQDIKAKAVEGRLSIAKHGVPNDNYIDAFIITDSLNGREYLVVKSNTGISITPIIK